MKENVLKKGAPQEKKQALAEDIEDKYEGIKELCTSGFTFIGIAGKKTVQEYDNYQTKFMEDEGHIITALVSAFFRFHGKEKFEKIINEVCRVNGKPMYKLSLLSKEGAKELKKTIGKENLKGICHGCNKGTYLNILKKCGTCKDVSYCSRECQKADWKEHKPKCCAAH